MLEPPRRLLVRGVNWLGDAVMTTPALQRLRAHWPEAHIALLTPQSLAGLWLHHPSLDAVLGFEPSETLWSVARRLRRENFDAALVLPNSPRSALEVCIARIPHRIGYARPWRRWFLTQQVAPRPGRAPMRKRSGREVRNLIRRQPEATTHVPPATHQAHQIHDYLHLVAALGAHSAPLAPRLEVAPAEIEAARDAWLSGLGNPQVRAATPQSLYLGLNPSAAYGPAKRWPAENFAAVAREIARRRQHSIWLAFGSASDLKLCDEIARLAGGSVTNLAGRTSLREFMALLKLCRVLLTNDSGPMHVAAALGTPVVVPFGSTSPLSTGPGLPGDTRHFLFQSDAPCSPCFRRTCPIDFDWPRSAWRYPPFPVPIRRAVLPLLPPHVPNRLPLHDRYHRRACRLGRPPVVGQSRASRCRSCLEPAPASPSHFA
jgi:heptosyltransferase II